MGALLWGIWQRNEVKKNVLSKEVSSKDKGRWAPCPLGKPERVSRHREVDLHT